MLEYDDTLAERLETLGLSTVSERTREDGTICRPLSSSRRNPEALSRLLPDLSRGSEEGAELTLGSVIARGGMGVICEATQRSLQRQVAAKRVVHRSDGSTATTSELIFEGRVMGMLDHPNIAPVYMLGKDDQGEVILVMKRIEGESWSESLEGPQRGDDLTRHIDILMDVCRAVEFAHGRDVLHRDLKPENVMLGAFGEVYLLDWGLAVSTRDDDERGLPLATEEEALAGTPGYMAPEMITLDSPLGPHTDSFQLGAILHRIVTGERRFGGHGFEILRNTHRCEPFDYDETVPEELQHILHKACARSGQERYSPAELREALAAFVKHENARHLAAEADERLAKLHSGLPTSGDDIEFERLFAEARFGYRQALAIDPESMQARRGLEAATLAMCAYALGCGRLGVARQLLEELADPPPELRAEIEKAEEERELSVLEYERLQHKAEQSRAGIGRSTRGTILTFGGIVWGLAVVVAKLFELSPLPLMGGVAASVAVLTFFLWASRRKKGRSNSADQVSSLQTSGTVTAMAITIFAGHDAGIPTHLVLAICQLFIASGQIALTLFMDRRLWWGIVLFYGSVIPIFIWPAHSLILSASLAGGGLVAVGLTMLYLGDSEPDAIARPPRD